VKGKYSHQRKGRAEYGSEQVEMAVAKWIISFKYQVVAMDTETLWLQVRLYTWVRDI